MKISKKYLKKLIQESVFQLDSFRKPMDSLAFRARDLDYIPDIIQKNISREINYIPLNRWPDFKQQKLIRDLFKKAGSKIYLEDLHIGFYEDFDTKKVVTGLVLIDLGDAMQSGHMDYLEAFGTQFAQGFGFRDFIKDIMRFLGLESRDLSDPYGLKEPVFSPDPRPIRDEDID